ncbi:glycosyltransferase [Coprococcus catus]
MKKILIVYPEMFIGGSTTSLLGLLSVISREEYEIDLQLYSNSGALFDKIPGNINLLDQACLARSIKAERIMKLTNPVTVIKKIQSRLLARKSKFPLVESQLMCYENARLSRKNKVKYDVAIAFLEGWPSIYVAKYINANKKYAWVHVDYSTAGFDSQFDSDMYSSFNKIISVSENCRENMCNSFPNLRDRMIWIGNISDVDEIIAKSKEEICFTLDSNNLNLISVCRLSMRHKGLDRMLSFIEMYKKTVKPRIRWYVIGDGPDREEFVHLIEEKDLQQEVVLLGAKINPFPYIVGMDGFILFSRYEGKPMAVTESQVLGVPVFVTEYASAREQITNLEDGYILCNCDDTLIDEALSIITKENCCSIKKSMQRTSSKFEKEAAQINALLTE